MPPASTSLSGADSGLEVFTTTIFVNGPTNGAGQPSESVRIPVGSIVGGLLGGIFLALAAVGGWVWWGKAIERNARKEQPPLRSAIKRDPYREGRTAVRGSNASISGSRNVSRRSLQRTPPPMGAVSQKSVTFADEGTESKTPSPAGSLRNGQLEEKAIERGRLTSTPPRSAMRSPLPARRSQSSERGYAPARPSPLSFTSRPPTRRTTVSMSERRSPAVSLRAPSPAAMYSRSPTPTGGPNPPPLRTKRRNSAPPAPPSPIQRTLVTESRLQAPPAAVSTPAVNVITPLNPNPNALRTEPVPVAEISQASGSRLNIPKAFSAVATRLSTITDRTSMLTTESAIYPHTRSKIK